MNTVNQQTIIDLAVQAYGNIDAMMQLIFDNQFTGSWESTNTPLAVIYNPLELSEVLPISSFSINNSSFLMKEFLMKEINYKTIATYSKP